MFGTIKLHTIYSTVIVNILFNSFKPFVVIREKYVFIAFFRTSDENAQLGPPRGVGCFKF
jgi:hypothetical protein